MPGIMAESSQWIFKAMNHGSVECTYPQTIKRTDLSW